MSEPESISAAERAGIATVVEAACGELFVEARGVPRRPPAWAYERLARRCGPVLRPPLQEAFYAAWRTWLRANGRGGEYRGG